MISIKTMRQPNPPGKTDCRGVIYLRDDLPADIRMLVHRHELYHCYAQHALRRENFFADKKPNYIKWNIAADCEIARAIYSEDDIALITAPRSILNGAVLPDTIKAHKNIVTAEELYEYIPDDMLQNIALDVHTQGEEKEEKQEKQGREVDAQKAREDAIKAVKKAEEKAKREAAARNAQAAVEKECALPKPHSISEEIAAIAAGSLKVCESYVRPNRRNSGRIIKRGYIVKRHVPKILIAVDRSGSFSPHKTAQSEKKLKELISAYGGRVNADIIYFGDSRLYTKDPLHGNGDTPYYLVAAWIDKYRPVMSIIITDNDEAEPYTPPKGCAVFAVPIGCEKSECLKNWRNVKC